MLPEPVLPVPLVEEPVLPAVPLPVAPVVPVERVEPVAPVEPVLPAVGPEVVELLLGEPEAPPPVPVPDWATA
jgi:hypothetical protein